MNQDSSWFYSDIVKDHFMNPRNILEHELGYNEDGRGLVGSMACGDQMLIVIKVKEGVITDCKWKTYGCASAIASTSMLSEIARGMTLKEAYQIKPEDITIKLGGLPDNKIHCSVLGDRALRAAIDDYFKRNGMENDLEKEAAVIICECHNVTDQDIEAAVKKGIHDFEALQAETKIATACGKCKNKALDVLHEYNHIFGKGEIS